MEPPPCTLLSDQFCEGAQIVKACANFYAPKHNIKENDRVLEESWHGARKGQKSAFGSFVRYDQLRYVIRADIALICGTHGPLKGRGINDSSNSLQTFQLSIMSVSEHHADNLTL